jgi:hypothetical protein
MQIYVSGVEYLFEVAKKMLDNSQQENKLHELEKAGQHSCSWEFNNLCLILIGIFAAGIIFFVIWTKRHKIIQMIKRKSIL